MPSQYTAKPGLRSHAFSALKCHFVHTFTHTAHSQARSHCATTPDTRESTRARGQESGLPRECFKMQTSRTPTRCLGTRYLVSVLLFTRARADHTTGGHELKHPAAGARPTETSHAAPACWVLYGTCESSAKELKIPVWTLSSTDGKHWVVGKKADEMSKNKDTGKVKKKSPII